MSGALRVPLGRAERALVELWAADPSTVRISAGTLVVVCGAGRAAEVSGMLDRLGEDLPCRSLVVVLDDATSGSPELEAEVRLVRRGSGVACERLVVRADRDRALGAALPLTVPDMPVRLWWALPRIPPERVLAEVAGGEVVIVDSREMGLDGLSPDRGWADLAWGRLGPWREAIASPFDEPERRARALSLTEVELVHVVGPDTDARLVAGWLADRLGWSNGGAVPNGVSARHPGGEVRVSWRAADAPDRPAGELLSVRLRAGGWSCALDRQPAGPSAVVEVQPEGVTWRAKVESPDAARLIGRAFGDAPAPGWDRAIARLRSWGAA